MYMSHMNEVYGRDLDLNLLRVFAVVAQSVSVTRAVGEPLFTRVGRGLSLTARGERMAEQVEPLLRALVQAALAPPRFEPATSERTVRVGISDAMEGALLAPLLQLLAKQAPRMRLIALPVQFRSVVDALTSRRVDMAVTVAD